MTFGYQVRFAQVCNVRFRSGQITVKLGDSWKIDDSSVIVGLGTPHVFHSTIDTKLVSRVASRWNAGVFHSFSMARPTFVEFLPP